MAARASYADGSVGVQPFSHGSLGGCRQDMRLRRARGPPRRVRRHAVEPRIVKRSSRHKEASHFSCPRTGRQFIHICGFFFFFGMRGGAKRVRQRENAGHAPRPQRDARAHAAASTRYRDARARFSRKPMGGRGEKAMRARRQPQRAGRSSPRARRLRTDTLQRRCPPRTPPVPRKGRRAISGSVSSPCYATSSSLKRPQNVR